jgi:hypothetical protein
MWRGTLAAPRLRQLVPSPRYHSSMQPFESMSPQDIAKAILIPLERWKDGCTWIVAGMRQYKLITAAIEKAAPGPFSEARFHMWMRLADGRVVDPTRWCYEGREPYIYVGYGDGIEYVPTTGA